MVEQLAENEEGGQSIEAAIVVVVVVVVVEVHGQRRDLYTSHASSKIHTSKRPAQHKANRVSVLLEASNPEHSSDRVTRAFLVEA